MESTLSLSDLSHSQLADSNDDDNDDIEMLRNKVLEYQMKLEKMNTDANDRKQRYENELGRMHLEIEDAKKIMRDSLEQQKIDQKQKYKNLHNKFTDEKMRFEEHLKSIMRQNAQLERSHTEMLQIDQHSKLLDEQRCEENERSKNIEKVSIDFYSNPQIAKKAKRYGLKTKLKRLEQEVFDLQTTRREMENSFVLNRQKIVNKFELHQTENKSLFLKLQQDIRDREEEYKLHLDVTKRIIEKEKSRNETEMKMINVQCEALKKLYLSISKRCGQQLSILNSDIEKMKRILQDRENEMEKNDSPKIKKHYDFVRNANSIHSKATEMKNELTRTKLETELSISYLRQHSSKSLALSSKNASTPKKHSVFS